MIQYPQDLCFPESKVKVSNPESKVSSLNFHNLGKLDQWPGCGTKNNWFSSIKEEELIVNQDVRGEIKDLENIQLP